MPHPSLSRASEPMQAAVERAHEVPRSRQDSNSGRVSIQCSGSPLCTLAEVPSPPMGGSLLTQNKALETHLHQLLQVSVGVRLNQVQGPLYQLLPTQHQCSHMGRKTLVMPAFRNRLLGGLRHFLSNFILLCTKKGGGRR